MRSNWRSNNIDAVIHLREYQSADEIKSIVFPKLDQFLVDFDAVRYGYIIHDRDIEDDEKELNDRKARGDGNPYKIMHIHLCAEFAQKHRGRQMTAWINKIADVLGINSLAITIDKMESFEGAFQYLVHKRNPEKYQYSVDDIQTSLPSREVDAIMAMDLQSFSFTFLCDAVDTSSNLRELIEKIGFKRYVAYRPVILDLWKERAFDKAQSTHLTYLEDEFKLVVDGCMGLTANPEYIRKGYIPLKDYEDLLISLSKTMADYLTFRRKLKGKASA